VLADGRGRGSNNDRNKNLVFFLSLFPPTPFLPPSWQTVIKDKFLSFIPYPGLFSLSSFSISYELLSITIVNETENIHNGKFILSFL
jgi:hypothetical protein